MVLRAHGRKAENTDDLRAWLQRLPAAPPVTHTLVLACGQHGDERPTWSYVQADAVAGVAKRRCLACGFVVSVLDSDVRWTFPPVWACSACGQCLAELAAGLSSPDGEHVEWVAVAARCVGCGAVQGLTDFVLPGVPVSQVLVGL